MKFGWRLRRIWSAGGPYISFAVTIGLALFLYLGGGGQRGRIVAFADSETLNAAAVETGRIASITVQPGQRVVAGQILVTLDAAALDAEIALLEAARSQILTLGPAERVAEAQKLDESVEQIERELAREQEELSRARSEQKVLDGERARTKKLVEDKLAVSDELSRIDVRNASIKPMVDAKPRTIELLKKQLAAAQKRRKEVADARDAGAKEPLVGDLLVTTRELELLRLKRSDLVLRATSDGTVSQIWKRAGEVAVAGEPIVSTVSAPRRVVACVPEAQALRVGTGDRAKLWFRDAPGDPLSGTAATLGPIVTELALRCRRVPTLPAYGREVIITLDQPVELVAGQAFDVQFDRSVAEAAKAAPIAPPPAVAADTGAPRPALMNIPAALRARSRLEPSGALWRPELSRYVIVSDDTGQEGAGERAPWLFAMSREGAMDPEPLPIEGIGEINDLESIAAGEGGEVFVLSSQSFSKKGKRPPSRTSFIRLMPSGRGFRADAELRLASTLEAAGSEAMARLGLPDGTKDLEIEGMAYHRGALYLGLKTPLDAQGNALIWRLGDPRALFAQKSIEHADLTLWARARVDADAGGKKAPGGVSELLFLPDGSLLIASTPSKAESEPESGRLWHVATPAGGALSPREIRAFPGLKPEGLSLSPTPGKILVVFDTGGDVPSWMEIPWAG